MQSRAKIFLECTCAYSVRIDVRQCTFADPAEARKKIKVHERKAAPHRGKLPLDYVSDRYRWPFRHVPLAAVFCSQCDALGFAYWPQLASCRSRAIAGLSRSAVVTSRCGCVATRVFVIAAEGRKECSLGRRRADKRAVGPGHAVPKKESSRRGRRASAAKPRKVLSLASAGSEE